MRDHCRARVGIAPREAGKTKKEVSKAKKVWTPATAFEVNNVRYAARDWLKTITSLPESVVLKRIQSPMRFIVGVQLRVVLQRQ